MNKILLSFGVCLFFSLTAQAKITRLPSGNAADIAPVLAVPALNFGADRYNPYNLAMSAGRLRGNPY
jgi:hypothetical protein